MSAGKNGTEHARPDEGRQNVSARLRQYIRPRPRRLAAAAEQALGHIDILINSAGGSKPAIGVDAPDSAWEESMTLNFVRVRQLTHAVLPGMMKRHWGRVINISGKSEPEALIAASRPAIEPQLHEALNECQGDYDEERKFGWAIPEPSHD